LCGHSRDWVGVSYQHFSEPAGLQQLVADDLAVLLSERFEMTRTGQAAAGGAPLAGALPVPATPLLGPEQEAAAVEGLVPCCRVRPGRNQCFKPPDHPAAGNDAGPPPGTLTASVNHRL
jgi:hypothetical protein